MRINRTELLAALTDFTNTDSGVIIGIPGVGKSHILAELVVSLVDQNIPASLLKLDNLTKGTDEEIANALGMPDANWIAALKEIPSPTTGRATLVFDAFDTLRDETLKDAMLLKIAEAKKELPNWSVIVSVRTYDARQSQKLIALFPAKFAQDGLDCRKFGIPELSEAELQHFLATHASLLSLYSIANDRLKEIFRIPFYLKLLDLILTKELDDTNSLSVIKSEIELLDRYWNKVVGNIKPVLATEIVLKKLTSEMIAAKQLSVNKYSFLASLSHENILLTDRLLSENVLKEQGPVTDQLAYSHNILFDYAVSKLVLQGSAKEIIQFIADDPTRPLFLRPSFIYFFTRLWYQDRSEFWRVYDDLAKHNTVDNVRLFNKLIPSAVIVREFELADDIIWAQDNTEEHGGELTDILQGFRYLKPRATIVEQASLIETLSKNLHFSFLGDFCILLNTILSDEAIKTSNEALLHCGIASRNLFDFSMAHRHDEGINLENLIAIHAVPDVAKTFGSDQPESKKRLKEVLATIATPGFNINCISNITSEIGGIYLHDVDFVIEIFKAVFEHQETEATETTMHQSTLLTLHSNRIDEFNMCRFRLREFFPTLLKAFPEKAVQLTIDLFHGFVHRRNSDGINISAAYSIPTDMIINGNPAQYEVDLSHFWSSLTDHHDEVGLVRQLFRLFDSLIESNEIEKLKGLIAIYVRHAHSAYLWAQLLDWAAKHSEILHNNLYDLLLQPPILYWSDTLQQAGNFLEKGVEWYSPDQLKKIEDTIAQLGDYVAESEIEKTNATIFRLLSRIPKTKLQRDDTKILFEDKEPAANDELVTYTSSSELYTTKMFLADEGVDVNDPLADKLLIAEQQLSNFTRGFDRLPDADSYKEALQLAFDTYDEIKDHPELSEKLVGASLVSIAGTCELVLRSDIHVKYIGETRLTEYQKFKEIILDCVSRHSSSDVYAEENYSVAGGFTSTPRSEGASGLINLYALTNDDSLLPIIKQFAVDKNAITRFNVNRFLGNLYTVNKDLYWEIELERLANEEDKMLWSTIVGSLDRKSIFDNEPDKLLTALTIAQANIKKVAKDSKFFENFLLTTLSFYRLTGNAAAKELILKCVRENILVTQSVIWSILEIVQPENFHRNVFDQNDNDLSKRLVDLLLVILDESDAILKAAANDTEPTPEVDETFRILNQMVMRIYFSLQVNERLHQPGRGKFLISADQQRAFYWIVKPVLDRLMQISEAIKVMQGYTAHYFIEMLGLALDFDAEFALSCARKITEMASRTTYVRDASAIQEVVRFTEKLLGNHRVLLLDPTAFEHLKAMLDIYATAGWPQALNLLWQLDEIFR
jgi:hypothetical protein